MFVSFATGDVSSAKTARRIKIARVQRERDGELSAVHQNTPAR